MTRLRNGGHAPLRILGHLAGNGRESAHRTPKAPPPLLTDEEIRAQADLIDFCRHHTVTTRNGAYGVLEAYKRYRKEHPEKE